MSSTDRTVRHLFCSSVTSEQRDTDTYINNGLIGTAVMYSRNILRFTATQLCLVLTRSCRLTQSFSNFGSRHVFTGLPLAFFLVSSSVISWLPYDFPPKARSLKTSRQTAEVLRQGKPGRPVIPSNTVYTRQVLITPYYCEISNYQFPTLFELITA